MDSIGNTRVRELLATIPECDRLLDVGCVQHRLGATKKDNWLHQYLYDRADYVLGIDILEDEVRELQNEGYNVKVADAERLNLDQKFDVIVAGELIEHLSNLGQFLDGTREHLENDGLLIMSTPNPWGFHRFKQAVFGAPQCNPEHTCWLDERTLGQVLRRHGFESSFQYVRPVDFGITRLLYDVGFDVIGSTNLIARGVKSGETTVSH